MDVIQINEPVLREYLPGAFEIKHKETISSIL